MAKPSVYLPSSADLAADLWLALHARHPDAKVHTVGTRILVRFPTGHHITLTRVEANGILRWLDAEKAASDGELEDESE